MQPSSEDKLADVSFRNIAKTSGFEPLYEKVVNILKIDMFFLHIFPFVEFRKSVNPQQLRQFLPLHDNHRRHNDFL